MTVTCSSAVFAGTFGPGTGATINLTITASAGDTLHLWTTVDDTFSISGVSDATNGSWGAALNTVNDATNGQVLAQFRKENSAAGSIVITVTFSSASADFRDAAVVSLSGVSSPSLDQHTGQLQAAAGTGTDAVTTGLMSPTAQPAGVVALSMNTTAGASGPASGTGYTNKGTGWPLSFNLATVEFQRITSLTAIGGTFTSATAVAHVTLGAIYTEAGAGGIVNDALFFGGGP